MESSQDQQQKLKALKSHTPRGSILKTSGNAAMDHGQHFVEDLSHNHEVKFDEETIAEHDKDRGTRTKIDEPKTPYAGESGEHEHGGDVEMHGSSEGHQSQHEDKQVDEEIKHHLEEAERNKMLNAQLLHQQAQAEGGAMSQFHKDLKDKLEQTQNAQEDADKSKLRPFFV